MDDTLSKGSSDNKASPEDLPLSKFAGKKLKKQQSTAVSESSSKDLKREKALRKVLKEELKKKTDRLADAEIDLERQNLKVIELEKELKEKENNFLGLYLENSS